MSQSTIDRQTPLFDDDLLILERIDLYMRVIRNPKVSAAYKLLYISLVETYPAVLGGDRVSVSVWKIRENAGWASERTASYFFNDLQAIGALTYDAGQYSKDEKAREGAITAHSIFSLPESWDTRNTEARKKGRDADKERRENLRQLILACEECGSDQIKYTLLPTCKSCGHKHQAIKDVPARDITLAPSEADEDNLPGLDDGFMAPARPAPSFTNIPKDDKYPSGCRVWSLHRSKWKRTISGLHCPVCEPAYGI